MLHSYPQDGSQTTLLLLTISKLPLTDGYPHSDAINLLSDEFNLIMFTFKIIVNIKNFKVNIYVS